MSRAPLHTLVLVLATLAATAQLAQAAGLFAENDVDSRFKAKIMKEKARQNNMVANASQFDFTRADGSQDPSCGSQSIGNVDTRGRPGTRPGEVFVFAPNAINIVSGNGCR